MNIFLKLVFISLVTINPAMSSFWKNLLYDDETRHHRFLLDHEEYYNPPAGLSPYIVGYEYKSEELLPALPSLPQEMLEKTLTELSCHDLLQLRQVNRQWHSFINTDLLLRWLPTQQVTLNQHLPLAQLIGIQLRARIKETTNKPKFYSYEDEARYSGEQSYRTAFIKALMRSLKDKEKQIDLMAIIEKRFDRVIYRQRGYMTEKLFKSYTNIYPALFIRSKEKGWAESLEEAIGKDYYFGAKDFLNRNPDYVHNFPYFGDIKENTLIYTVSRRRLYTAHLLLHRGANVNSKSRTSSSSPLQIAVSERHPEMVNLLIEYGADVNYNYGVKYPSCGVSYSYLEAFKSSKFAPLYRAIKEDQPEIVRILLQHGARPEHCLKKEQTPLHLAIKLNAPKVLEFFLDEDVDTQVIDGKGLTLFQYALKEKKLELMQVFLCHKAEPDYLRIFWKAEDPYCSYSRNIAANIIEVFNSLEISINQPNNHGLTPLCYATLKKQEKYVKGLLQAGANVNYEGPEELTPLCYAVMSEDKSIVELLLQAKANVNHTISNGDTILSLVNQKNDSYTKISPLLKKYGV